MKFFNFYFRLQLFFPVLFTLGVLLLLVNNGTIFAQIPDYDNPYAPITTDKNVYSWTEKVRIKIVAPSWNSDKNAVNSIGGDSEHPIRISTTSHSLEPYRLTETSPNSGIFTGEVILTGFSHDVDGDGRADTTPRTFGSGPTGGFLQADRDDAITISFEFADGVVLTESATIKWNEGSVSFDKEQYTKDDSVIVRVIDPDMNLNPEAVDTVELEITSDSDSAGISVAAIETGEATGVFEAKVGFTQKKVSSADRLLAFPGNIITAKYEDRTLPRPNSREDSLDITNTARFESALPSTKRMSVLDFYAADSSGKKVEKIFSDESVQIVVEISNVQEFARQEQPYFVILQVKDEGGQVYDISWIQGQIDPNQRMEVSQSWSPTQVGNYTAQIFVWNSLQNKIPLSVPVSETFSVSSKM